MHMVSRDFRPKGALQAKHAPGHCPLVLKVHHHADARAAAVKVRRTAWQLRKARRHCAAWGTHLQKYHLADTGD